MITASQLYDYVQCPHRVYLDAFGDPTRKDEPNAFVELLWEQGVAHESDIVQTLGITADMSTVPVMDRERETRAAMGRGEPLIYQGRLTSGDRMGTPDLLKRRGGRYIAGDVKSGFGFDGDDDDGKLKKHYAVQVGHYANILDLEGLGVGHEAFVIDRTGSEVPYVLDEPQGVRNTTMWWQAYSRGGLEPNKLGNYRERWKHPMRGVVVAQLVEVFPIAVSHCLPVYRMNARGQVAISSDRSYRTITRYGW